MTDAPENITLKPNHLFGNPWSNAYIGDDDPMEDGEDTSYGYTRTDVTEARIKELEDVLMGYQDEFCEHGGDLCGRLKSGSCKGCRAATALKGENK